MKTQKRDMKLRRSGLSGGAFLAGLFARARLQTARLAMMTGDFETAHQATLDAERHKREMSKRDRESLTSCQALA